MNMISRIDADRVEKPGAVARFRKIGAAQIDLFRALGGGWGR